MVAIDSSSPPGIAGDAASVTSAPFTPPADAIIVAVALTPNGWGTPDVTYAQGGAFSDSLGGSWHALVSANTPGVGCVAIAGRDVGGAPASMTVTWTSTGIPTYLTTLLKVYVITGAGSSVTGALGVTPVDTTGAKPEIAITPGDTGSLLLMGFASGNGMVPLPANADSTSDASESGAVIGYTAAGSAHATSSSTAGLTATIGYTVGPTYTDIQLAAVEIRPAGGAPPSPQTLDPSGITGGAALGTPIVADASALTVAPGSIGSRVALGEPLLSGGIRTINAHAIASTEAFGRARLGIVGQQLRAPGIPGAAALGEPVIGSFPAQFIAARGVPSTAGSGTPVFELVAAAARQVPSIASEESVGTPYVLKTLVAVDPGQSQPPPRNVLIDRQTREVYPWPLNHATEDPIRTLGRRLTRSGISASGRLTSTRKVILMSQAAHPGPVHLMLHGALIDRDQQQYATFVRFFEASDDRTFDFIDASHDSYHISIVGFDARRSNSPARVDGSYFTYSLECEVLDVHRGALKGYAV